MTTRLTEEKLHALVEAVEIASGQRLHLSTILRWCTRPRRGIKLESVMLGGRRLTSVQAVHRYMQAITEATDGTNTQTETPRQREKAAQRSASLLAKRLGTA